MLNILNRLKMELRWQSNQDGRWLTLGCPAKPRYSNNAGWRGDERAVESVFAEQALRLYQNLSEANILYGLDCGASDKPEAVRLQKAWQPSRWEWSAVDVNEVLSDLYVDRYKCLIGDLEGCEGEFDFILCVSVIEHAKQFGDKPGRVLSALSQALSDRGVLVLTTPVGVAMQMDSTEQFGACEMSADLHERFSVLHERFWLWNGDNWENCEPLDTAGCVYGVTNQPRCAAAVGGWVLAHRE